MSLEAGAHRFGPENGTLIVKTGRSGAASKAGHDLVLEVTSWAATLEVDEALAQARIELSADASSLRVREGRGGIQALDDGDKAGIQKTIDDEVLNGTRIEFRSSTVGAGPSPLNVEGELELAGQAHPIAFELTVGEDGRLAALARVRQTQWGIKPYSTLFGTLKVTDEVEVVLQASLPSS